MLISASFLTFAYLHATLWLDAAFVYSLKVEQQVTKFKEQDQFYKYLVSGLRPHLLNGKETRLLQNVESKMFTEMKLLLLFLIIFVRVQHEENKS